MILLQSTGSAVWGRNRGNVASNYERGDTSSCAWCQIQQEDESLAQNKRWVCSEVLMLPGAKTQFGVSNQSSVHVFGLWEEKWGEKPRRHGRRWTWRRVRIVMIGKKNCSSCLDGALFHFFFFFTTVEKHSQSLEGLGCSGHVPWLYPRRRERKCLKYRHPITWNMEF